MTNGRDLIDRQVAIDALKEKVFHNLTDEFYGTMQVLDELPSAQPEVRTQMSVADCVSRQAVLSYIDRIVHQGTGKQKSFEFMQKYVENMPSAQPEIIRCGDCAHKNKKIGYCHYLGITICERDYCSYAERREDG